jgi:hypothetical protein
MVAIASDVICNSCPQREHQKRDKLTVSAAAKTPTARRARRARAENLYETIVTDQLVVEGIWKELVGYRTEVNLYDSSAAAMCSRQLARVWCRDTVSPLLRSVGKGSRT